MAYVEEAKAHVRILKFAERAEIDGFPQIAHMFRAVAVSERIHSGRHYGLLEGSVGDTDENLGRAFHSETGVAEVEYRRMLTEAHEDGENVAALIFSQARDVEESHAGLYKRVMDHVIWEKMKTRSIMHQWIEFNKISEFFVNSEAKKRVWGEVKVRVHYEL